MPFNIYSNSVSAMLSFMPIDRNYTIVWHNLNSEEEIRAHYHPKANEWIIVNYGRFEITINEKSYDCDVGLDEFMVIPLPKKSMHSILAKTNLVYVVIRNRKDRIVYPKKAKLK